MNGWISINSSGLSSNKTYIAPYYLDLDTRKGGIIYYRQTSNRTIMINILRDIYAAGLDKLFKPTRRPTSAIIVTYSNVAAYSPSHLKHTFQVVLASNGKLTYAVLNYEQLDKSGAIAQYSEGGCVNSRRFVSRSLSRTLVSTGNVRVGRHAFLLTSNNCSGTCIFSVVLSL